MKLEKRTPDEWTAWRAENYSRLSVMELGRERVTSLWRWSFYFFILLSHCFSNRTAASSVFNSFTEMQQDWGSVGSSPGWLSRGSGSTFTRWNSPHPPHGEVGKRWEEEEEKKKTIHLFSHGPSFPTQRDLNNSLPHQSCCLHVTEHVSDVLKCWRSLVTVMRFWNHLEPIYWLLL